MMEQYRQSIVSDPKVMMGKPTIVGTRITVEFILESLAAGETPEQLLEGHQRLKREDIQAAASLCCTSVKGGYYANNSSHSFDLKKMDL